MIRNVTSRPEMFISPIWLLLTIPAIALFVLAPYSSRTAGLFRAAFLTLVILSLAQLAIYRQYEGGTMVVVADRSLSMPSDASARQKEIIDLRRYKQRIGSVETYTYADRIARREELLKEVELVKGKVLIVGDNTTAFAEFYRYLRGEKVFCELGEGNSFLDVVRYFYKETVKKYKTNYGLTSKKMYLSDAYALCVICSGITDRLSPVYSYVFVDEAQDISPCEYALLRKINKKASFNVFGDLAQNVTSWRGVKTWEEAFPDFEVYTLNQNYRNTNQIVEFVSENLRVDMLPTGFDGPSVEYIQPRGIGAFFREKK